VLAFSATNNNDKVGLLLFSDKVEKFLPPKKGRGHILRIIRELLNTRPTGTGTDIAMALTYFTNMVKRRSICFLLSDFLADGYEKPLRLAARRHDLIGMHLFDPREKDLPAIGLIHARDAETGQLQWVDTDSKRVRQHYTDWYENNMAYYKNAFKKSGADSMSIETTEDYTKALLGFFKGR
jgi:uncharacterized protein (DUF58 family)